MKTLQQKTATRDRTTSRPQNRQTLRARLDALVARYAELVTALLRAVIP